LQPTTSRACSPPLPNINSVEPAGELYPGNAVVRIVGYGLEFDQLEVTVDGAAATAIPASAPLSSLGTLVFTIDPLPEPGQEVKLSGTLCTEGPNCTLDVTYTADAHDLEAPASASSPQLSLHDYPKAEDDIGSCSSNTGLTYWLSFEHAEESPLVQVELYPADDPDSPLLSQVRSGTHLGLRSYDDTFSGVDLTEVCVSVRPFDHAGNMADAITTCGLCNFRDDAEEPEPFVDPAEPMWTVEDIVAGGVCADGVETGTDTGSETTDGEQTGTETEGGSETGQGSDSDSGLDTDKGCGCRQATPDAPLALLLGLGGLLWLRRR